MRRLRLVAAVVGVWVISLSGGCATTKLIDHWQSPEFSRSDMNNILVVAMTNNSTARLLFETEIARRAADANLTVATSQQGPGQSLTDRAAVEAYVKANGVDHIIVTRLANVEQEKELVPESVRTYYTGPWYPTYGHYYDDANTVTVVRDAYVNTRHTFVLVTTIYDVSTQQPVWVGRSESFEPASVINMATAVARITWRNIDR